MTDNTSHTTGGGSSLSLALPAGIELGHYRLLHKIGQGGFGITYLAENLQSHEQVVIKENLPTFYASRNKDTLHVSPLDVANAEEDYAHTLERFVDEARTLARLCHPNIVRVYEAFEALGTAYYVMPLIPGKELHKAIPAVVDEAWLLPILRVVLEALEYLHSQNLLHRDLKPGNILLQDDGTPMLIDFGTARALQSERSATMVGTPGYTPIEQITPHGKRGPWTDLYALGATCYRVITGELPPQSVERIDEDDPYRPLANRAELRKHFTPTFLQAIDTALAVRAKKRWQSAHEWLEVLSSPSATPSPLPPVTQSLPVTPLATEPTAPAKHQPLFLGLLALLLATGAAGAYSYIQSSTEKQVREEFAQAETARRAKEEAERLAREQAARKAKEEAQAKLKAMGITDYDEAIFQHYANPEKLKLLITAGADVNKEDKDGWTPLYWAAWKGHTECVKLLLAAPGIDVNKANKKGETPLYKAAWWGRTECVKLLLAAPGIEVNKADGIGRTPLYWAADKGRTECVKLLLSAPGIDVNKANKNGQTPLYWAAWGSHTECVKLLLSAPGIDISNWNALSIAVVKNDCNTIKQLLQSGADVNKADMKGETPLYWAATIGNTKCVKLLLAAPGIEVNKADKYGKTPLNRAALGGHTECVKLLLAAPGIEVNKAEEYGTTPLYRAAENGHTECVKLLLAAPGIEVNKADEWGTTPLHMAARFGHTECVKLLRAAGAKE